jgi:hypothetical protein
LVNKVVKNLAFGSSTGIQEMGTTGYIFRAVESRYGKQRVSFLAFDGETGIEDIDENGEFVLH